MGELKDISWKVQRELILVNKVTETKDVKSFYFKAKDNEKLKTYKPGQFLPFKIKTEDPKYKTATRTYSLSMKPNDKEYRISVKKIEGGLISTYLHEKLEIGDSIIAMPPGGNFTLKENSKNIPLVLMSGGIGITPVLSMLYEAVGKREDIYFIQAVMNSKEQPLADEVKKFSDLNLIKSIVFYSEPLENDIQGENYNFDGFVNEEWIRESLPLNAEFYFCGPPPFMKAVNKALLNLGVSKENINFEFFGKSQSME